jgi:RNA polymerase sigma-70 factor (ECF subfamily)
MRSGEIQHPEGLAGYREGVYRLLLFLTRDSEAAEELAQETFTVALSKGPDAEKGADYGAWLRSIARNLLRNYQRKKRVKWLVFSDDVMELAEHRFAQAGAGRDDQWELRRNALLSCIQKLPEAGRTLLLRRYQLGRSVNQIASDIGIEPGSLSRKFMNIRRILRDCINAALRGL